MKQAKSEFKGRVESRPEGREDWRTIAHVQAYNGLLLRQELVSLVNKWRQHSMDHKGAFSNYQFRTVTI